MRYVFLIILIALIGINSPGRTRSELEEWREKGLPTQVKRGVVVEIYDLVEGPGREARVNIRVHNLSDGRIGVLTVKVWFWKGEGVHVEEIELIKEGENEDLARGREKFFPGKGSYYQLKDVEYKKVERVELEISRILSKRS